MLTLDARDPVAVRLKFQLSMWLTPHTVGSADYNAPSLVASWIGEASRRLDPAEFAGVRDRVRAAVRPLRVTHPLLAEWGAVIAILDGVIDHGAGTPTLAGLNDILRVVRRGEDDAVQAAGRWSGAALRIADARTLLEASDLLVRVTDGRSVIRWAEPGLAEALRLLAEALSVAGKMTAAEPAPRPARALTPDPVTYRGR